MPSAHADGALRLSLDYDTDFRHAAASTTPSRGRIFLGDLRHLELLPAFQASITLHKALGSGRSVTLTELGTRTERGVRSACASAASTCRFFSINCRSTAEPRSRIREVNTPP